MITEVAQRRLRQLGVAVPGQCVDLVVGHGRHRHVRDEGVLAAVEARLGLAEELLVQLLALTQPGELDLRCRRRTGR